MSRSGPKMLPTLGAHLMAAYRKLVSSSHNIFLLFQCSYIHYKYYKYLQRQLKTVKKNSNKAMDTFFVQEVSGWK